MCCCVLCRWASSSASSKICLAVIVTPTHETGRPALVIVWCLIHEWLHNAGARLRGTSSGRPVHTTHKMCKGERVPVIGISLDP